MNKPQTFPGYLPAIDRRLEYQAGLFSPARPLPQEGQPAKIAPPAGPRWLGEDFSHVIESR